MVKPDAGSERRLQQVTVGRGRGPPTDCTEIGCEDLGTVGCSKPDLRPPIVLNDSRSPRVLCLRAEPIALARINLAPHQRIDTPRAAAGERDIEKDEAIKNGGVAAVQNREKARRRMG